MTTNLFVKYKQVEKTKTKVAPQGTKVPGSSKAEESQISKIDIVRGLLSYPNNSFSKKMLEFNNVLQAECKDVCGSEDIRIPGFNLKGKDMVDKFIKEFVDMTARIYLSPKASSVFEDYVSQFSIIYQANTRASIVTNLIILKAGAKLADIIASQSEIEVITEIFGYIIEDEPAIIAMSFADRCQNDFLDVDDKKYIYGDDEAADKYAEANAARCIAEAMANNSTREILIMTSMKSDNVSAFITHVGRVLAMMYNGTSFSSSKDIVIKTAEEIYFHLNMPLF